MHNYVATPKESSYLKIDPQYTEIGIGRTPHAFFLCLTDNQIPEAILKLFWPTFATPLQEVVAHSNALRALL